MRPLDAVTFDFWNTLVGHQGDDIVGGSRISAVASVLGAAGISVEHDRLDAAMQAALASFHEHWRANVQFTGTDAAVFATQVLGLDLEPAVQDQVTRAWLTATSELVPDKAPNIDATIRSLKARGLRIGIVSDVGFTPSGTLREYLRQHDLLELFDHTSFSDEAGAYKPSAAIFEHAMEGLGGIDPERAAHVGDLRRTDVAGARNMGMVAVRYSGLLNDSEGAEEGLADGDHVIDDHAALAAALGLD